MLWKSYKFSDPKYHEENRIKITTMLIQNDYPKRLITKLIDDYLLKLNITNIHPEVKNNPKYFKFPFINGLTQRIQRIIEDDNHKLAVYNILTTDSLFTKLKDKPKKDEQINVIYKIKCKECPSVYIGQTKQHIKKRISQHKYDTKIKDGMVQLDKTALAKHRFEFDHQFDFENYKILDVESTRLKRNISEMIYITLEDNTVNERSDTNNLSKFYVSLLNILKTRKDFAT